jgi:hypothetical protein
MTKVIILGEQPEKKELKPIEFKLQFTDNKAPCSPTHTPNQWENVELISKRYADGLDLMYAYDNNRNDGRVYLGHFNDGVIEQ